MLRGYLQLIRPANMVTAAADTLAGFAASGLPPDIRLLSLAIAGVCLYGGGVAFNDIFDRELDRIERPERPLPSGRAQLARSIMVAVALLGTGIGLAFSVSVSTGILACAIATGALLYDTRAKHHWLAGPAVLGACRAMNFLMGLSAGLSALGARWYLALLPLTYIAAITAISSGEVHGGTRRTGALALLLEASVAGGLGALAAAAGPNAPATWILLGFLLFRVGPPFWRAYVLPDPGRIRVAVRAGVLSLVVLDSVVACAHAGALYGAGVLALLLVAFPLARLFPVT